MISKLSQMSAKLSVRQRIKSLLTQLDGALAREKHLYEENNRLAETAVQLQERVRQLEDWKAQATAVLESQHEPLQKYGQLGESIAQALTRVGQENAELKAKLDGGQ